MDLKDIPLLQVTPDELAQAFAKNRNYFLNIDAINKYLDANVNEQMGLVEFYPPYMNAMLMKGVHFYLNSNGFKVEKEENYKWGEKEIPVEYADMIVARDKTENLLSKGIMFCKNGDGKKVVLSVDFVTNPFGALEVTYLKKDKEFFADFITKVNYYADKADYMRGEKITASGRLLNVNEYDWGDIVLEDGIKEAIENNVLNFFTKRKLYEKNGIPFKRGVILEGPPGTGKTLISKIIANKVNGYTFILATAKDMAGSESVSNLFRLARRLAPTVIFMEDIDFFGPSRNGNGRIMRVTGELLNQMDGIEDNNGILVVATTNHPELIDDAIVRRPGRFDVILHIGELSLKNREILLTRFLSGRQKAEDVNLLDIALMCEGFSGSHIKDLANDVCIQAINCNSIDQDGDIILIKEFFLKAIERIKKHMGKEDDLCVVEPCDEPVCSEVQPTSKFIVGFDGFTFSMKR